MMCPRFATPFARVTGSLACPLLFVALLGCSSKPGTVNGTVTLAGTPVTIGTVSAIGKDNIPRSAIIRADGTFTMMDVPAGPIRVTVDSPEPQPMSAPPLDLDGPLPVQPATGTWRKLPQKYGNFDTSELQFEILSGENTIQVTLSE